MNRRKNLVALLLCFALLLSLTGTAALAEDAADAAAGVELNYVEGEDLLIVDQGGIKVWLETPNDLGVYKVTWGQEYAYVWFSMDFANDMSEDVYMGYSLSIDGYPVAENDLAFYIDANTYRKSGHLSLTVNPNTVIEKNPELTESDVENLIRQEKTATMTFEFGTDSEQLFETDPVTIHFGDGIFEPTGKDEYLGVWQLSGIIQNRFQRSAVGPLDKYSLVIEPDTITLTIDGETFQYAAGWTLEVDDDDVITATDDEGGNLEIEGIEKEGRRLRIWFDEDGNGIEFAPSDATDAENPADTAADADASSATGKVYTDKDTVKKAQQALNDAGYNCGTPDGIAGKNTAAAISQYQTDNGLTVTGTVTDELLAALGLN